jgi:hypothetical protein
MNWAAHYQSENFAVADYPNCTDPIGSGLTLNLTSHTAITDLFGGPICGPPPATITLALPTMGFLRSMKGGRVVEAMGLRRMTKDERLKAIADNLRSRRRCCGG